MDLSAYLILHFESEVDKLSGHIFDLMMVINKTIYYLIATQPPGEARLNTNITVCSRYTVDIGTLLAHHRMTTKTWKKYRRSQYTVNLFLKMPVLATSVAISASYIFELPAT